MGLYTRSKAAFASFRKSWMEDDASWATLDEVGARGGGYTFASRKAMSKSLSPEECYRLSIPVNTAVSAINKNGSRVVPRPFDAISSEEIVGGPLYDRLHEPSPNVGWEDFISELLAWYNISGEFAVWATDDGPDGLPGSWLILPPCNLFVELPTRPPKTLGDVVQWRYHWADGAVSKIAANRIAFGRMFNPDPTTIRGLSPLVTGSPVATAQHNAILYNKTFFENNGIPSHVLILPDGVPEATRKDIERRYLSEHGVYGNNAHKTFVISGKDTKIEKIEQPFQDAAFVELQKQASLFIAQLYRVPAIEMGLYDKTRFDTANEERKQFAENTLLPQIAYIQRVIQHQLVDRFYSFSTFTRRRPRGDGRKCVSKSVGANLEKAVASGKGRRIQVILDSDGMPVMNDVMLAKFENAEKMRVGADMSATEVIEFLNIDVEHREERDDIWVKNDRVNITDPEFNKKIIPGLIPKPAGEGGGDAKPKPAAKADEGETIVRTVAVSGIPPLGAPYPTSPESREKIEKAQKLLRVLRRWSIGVMDTDGEVELWGLDEADMANELGPEMAKEIRLLRYQLRQIIKQHAGKEDRIAAVKNLFKDASAKPHLRKALNL